MSVHGTFIVEVALDVYEIHLGSRYLRQELIGYGVQFTAPDDGPSSVVVYKGTAAFDLFTRMTDSLIQALGIRKFGFIYEQIMDHLDLLESTEHTEDADKDIKVSIQFFK
ncbi:hypothetical protein BN7874_037 [Phage NCTB]|jgi:hypothetical protein|nr:hypothetical protein BN7874_037 [Phage NCTB]